MLLLGVSGTLRLDYMAYNVLGVYYSPTHLHLLLRPKGNIVGPHGVVGWADLQSPFELLLNLRISTVAYSGGGAATMHGRK